MKKIFLKKKAIKIVSGLLVSSALAYFVSACFNTEQLLKNDQDKTQNQINISLKQELEWDIDQQKYSLRFDVINGEVEGNLEFNFINQKNQQTELRTLDILKDSTREVVFLFDNLEPNDELILDNIKLTKNNKTEVLDLTKLNLKQKHVAQAINLEFEQPHVVYFEDKTIITLNTTKESKKISHLFEDKKAQLVYLDNNQNKVSSNIVELNNNMVFEINGLSVVGINFLNKNNQPINYFKTNIENINFQNNQSLDFNLEVDYQEIDNQLFVKFASNDLVKYKIEYEITNKSNLNDKKTKTILFEDNEIIDETFNLEYNQEYQIKVLAVYINDSKLKKYNLNSSTFSFKTKAFEFELNNIYFQPINNQLSAIHIDLNKELKDKYIVVELINQDNQTFSSMKTKTSDQNIYFENLQPNTTYKVKGINVFENINSTNLSKQYFFKNPNNLSIQTNKLLIGLKNPTTIDSSLKNLNLTLEFDQKPPKIAQVILIDDNENQVASLKEIVNENNQVNFSFNNLKPNKNYKVLDVLFFDNLNAQQSIWFEYKDKEETTTSFITPKQNINISIQPDSWNYNSNTRSYSFAVSLDKNIDFLRKKHLQIQFVDNLNNIYQTSIVEVESNNIVFETQSFKPNREYLIKQVIVYDDANLLKINEDFNITSTNTSIKTPQTKFTFNQINQELQGTNQKAFQFNFSFDSSDLIGKFAEITFFRLNDDLTVDQDFDYTSPRFLITTNNIVNLEGLRKNNQYVVGEINIFESNNTTNDLIPMTDFVFDTKQNISLTVLRTIPININRITSPRGINWNNNRWELTWNLQAAIGFYFQTRLLNPLTNQIYSSHKTLNENGEVVLRFDDLEPNTTYKVLDIDFYDTTNAINTSEYINGFNFERLNVTLTTSAQTINVVSANTQISYLRTQRKFNFNLTLDRFINKYIEVKLSTPNPFFGGYQIYTSNRVFITSDNVNVLFDRLPSNREISFYGINIYDNATTKTTSRSYHINTQAIASQTFVVKASDYVFDIAQEQRILEANEKNTSHSFNYEIDTEASSNYYLGFELVEYDKTNNQEIANTSFFTTNQLINSNKRYTIHGLKTNTSYLIKKALIYLKEDDEPNTGIVAKMNNEIVITTPSINSLNARTLIQNIYNQNANDTRSAAEFLASRTLQFSYSSAIYELYGSNRQNRFRALSKAGTLGTSWIIDKDLSDIDNRTYYVATNIHVVANLKYPKVLTNSIKFAKENNNYELLNTKEFNKLNTALRLNNSFELRYNGVLPTTSFSNVLDHSLSLFDPNQNGSWNNEVDLPANLTQAVIISRKANNYYSGLNDRDNNDGFNYNAAEVNQINNPVYENDNVESYELINPLLYDFYFKNYWQTNPDGTPRETLYKNTGIDFAVVKIKLKSTNNLLKPFEEYENSPTLLGKLKTENGKTSTKRLSIYGYSGAERIGEENRKEYKTKNSLADALVASRYFNEDLLIFNETDRQWYRLPSNIDYVARSTTILKTKINFNNTLAEAEGDVEVNDALFATRWYISTQGRLGVFRGGSSGSGVIDSDKLIVGIFYASQDENDFIDNENDRDVQYFHEILPTTDAYNPVLYYLNSRTENNSWLKRHWEAISELSK